MHETLSHKSSTPQLDPRKQLGLYHLWLSQNCHHQSGSKAEGSASALSSQLPAREPKVGQRRGKVAGGKALQWKCTDRL